MRLPGSNIEVTFESECVIVRDGNTSKIIDISGMTFDDILSEVQTFAYFRNVRPARRLIRFILIRAGLPDQQEFPRTDILEEEDIETLSKALGSVDDLADRFFSPHYDEPSQVINGSEQIDEDIEISEIEEAPELELPQEPEIPPSERSSIWTGDQEVEIIYRFAPENIPQEEPIPVVPEGNKGVENKSVADDVVSITD
ncbi:MAG: hypothetical protein ACFFF4_15825 [Candidatus Thorarchaeota archaeon]